MIEDQPESQPAPDPWEEEIDLREVGRGIFNKWYIWVTLPILAVLLTAGYYALQPTKFRLTSHFTVDYQQPDLKHVGVNFPARDILRNRVRSTSLARKHFASAYPTLTEEDRQNALVGFLAGWEITVDTGIQPMDFRVVVETSRPDSAATVMEGVLRDFETRETRRLKERLRTKNEEFINQLTSLSKDWTEWNQSWKRVVGDTFADFIKPRLEQARSDYNEAVKKLDEVRRNYNLSRAKLTTVQNLLQNEPKMLGYQNSLSLPLLFTGESASEASISSERLSEYPSEVMNKAYLDLRKRRVNNTVAFSRLKIQKQTLKEQIQESRKTVERLEQQLPDLQQRKQTLEARREFLSQRITNHRDDISRIEVLLSEFPDLISVYPAESPGVLISGADVSRNVLLAGVITFLLSFFVVAFWEIL